MCSFPLRLLLLFFAPLALYAEEDRVYTIQVHDLPNPSSVEYPPFQAMLDDHPQIRYERYSQLQLQGLGRGSLLMSIAGGAAPGAASALRSPRRVRDISTAARRRIEDHKCWWGSC